MNKILVAYFSCTGVTKKVAQVINNLVNSDLIEIKPEEDYSTADLDWTDKHSRSTLEMGNMNSRPRIKGNIKNMDEYEIVFVGFPIWWYVAPTIINTFLESYDMNNKTIIPFATSGSSGVGETDDYLHLSCSYKTTWVPARRLPANADEKVIRNWLDSLSEILSR